MNKIPGLILSCMLGVLVCLSQPVAAHEFIVKPTSFSLEPGKQISVEVLSAHVFMESEEIEPINQVTVHSLAETGSDTHIPLTEQKDKLVLSGNIPADSKSSIIAGHRKGMIWTKTTKGWEQKSKKDLTGVLSSGKYEKFSKALITAPGNGEMLRKPVGHRLEIIPLTDHLDIHPGDELRCKVVFDGKPLATEIFATFDGFSSQPGTYAYYSKSNDIGEATVKISEQGTWMIRVQHEIDSATEDYDKEVLRAVLLFSIEG